MRGLGSNSTLIRFVLIVLFLAITQIFRAVMAPRKPKPAAGGGAGNGKRTGDLLREALRQSPEQASAPRSMQPTPPERFQISERSPLLQQPPKIGPESSFVPSFLLLALFVCLCAMAYRYWAR
jgi:hypothetical protein